jgi:hypothetical protein
MVQDIVAGSAADAQDRFAQVMSAKITDALEQRKTNIAQNLYKTEPEATDA